MITPNSSSKHRFIDSSIHQIVRLEPCPAFLNFAQNISRIENISVNFLTLIENLNELENSLVPTSNSTPTTSSMFSKAATANIPDVSYLNEKLGRDMVAEIRTGSSSNGLFTIIACDEVKGSDLLAALLQKTDLASKFTLDEAYESISIPDRIDVHEKKESNTQTENESAKTFTSLIKQPILQPSMLISTSRKIEEQIQLDESTQSHSLLKTVNQLPVQNLPKINKFRILDKKTEEYIRENFTHEIEGNRVESYSKHEDSSHFIAIFSPGKWIFAEAFKKDYSPAYHSNDIKLFQIKLLAESKGVPYQDFPMPHTIRMEHIINETTLEETKDKTGKALENALFTKTPNGKSVWRTLKDLDLEVTKVEKIRDWRTGIIHFDIEVKPVKKYS